MLGLILAGGQSKRFGSDKALFRFKNQPVNNAELAVNKIVLLCEQVIVCANPVNYDYLFHQFAKRSKIKVIKDQPPFQNCGPLSGVYAANCLFKQENDFLLLAVDYPFISESVLTTMANHPNSFAATPEYEHYAIAHFRTSLQQLQNFLESGNFSLQKFLKTVNHCEPINFPNSVLFTNYNRLKENKNATSK